MAQRRRYGEIKRNPLKVYKARRRGHDVKGPTVETLVYRTSEGDYGAQACFRRPRETAQVRYRFSRRCGRATTGATPSAALASALHQLASKTRSYS